MNKIKFAIGAIALLIATGGAFASAKSFSFATVYYVSGATCLQATVDHECVVGQPDCFADIPNGPTNVQIYADLEPIGTTGNFRCIDPLDETPSK